MSVQHRGPPPMDRPPMPMDRDPRDMRDPRDREREHVQAPAHHHHHHHSHIHTPTHAIPTPTAMHAAAAAVVNGPPPPHMVGPPPGPDPRDLRGRDYPGPPPGSMGMMLDHPGALPPHHGLPPPGHHMQHVHPSHAHVHPGPPGPPPGAYGPPPPGVMGMPPQPGMGMSLGPVGPPGFPPHHHQPPPPHGQHQMAPITGIVEHDLDLLLRSGRSDEPWNAPRGMRRPSEIPVIRELDKADHDTWCQIGAMAEQLNELDRAMECYQRALRHDPDSKRALSQIGAIARAREDFPTAVDYLSRVLSLDQQNGELWSALGHCYLMLDILPKAYSAYQQALYCLASPTNVKLWYGIGILYDRYGSLEHAEEAFTSVLRMEEGKQPSSLNTNEVYFRLGIIYKQQHKYDQSLECFQRIADEPPAPLKPSDILFQIGHVYEQKGEFDRARSAYERVLQDMPTHAKVLQQLGWLYFQSHTSFHSTENAIECLTRSLGAGSLNDESDAQSWYLLGRAYMAAEKYNKAYEAYQQAVYRDGRNPTFWCSIGVLYYQIQQFRDALDAYSRAIRINPYISEVWFDLGCLYESCNNQISDAIDAYKRALELDTDNQGIKDRLRLLEDHKSSGGPPPPPPPVQDVHPTAYASSQGQLGPPTSLGLPLSLGVPSPRYPMHGGAPLPPMATGHRISSPAAYGPPHDSFRPPHMASAETSRTGMALAPMDTDRAGPSLQHGPAPALPSMAHEPPYGRGPPSSMGEMHSMQQAQMQQQQQHGPLPPSRGPYDQPPRHEQHRGPPPPRVPSPVRTHSTHHQHSGSYSSHHALLNPSTPPTHAQPPPHYPPGYRGGPPPPQQAERDHAMWEQQQRGPPSARPGYDMPPRGMYDTPTAPPMRERERDGRESEMSTPHRGYDARRPPSPREMRRPEVTRSPVVPHHHGDPAWQQQQQQPPQMQQQPIPPPIQAPPAQQRRYDPLYDEAAEARRREMERERREPPPPQMPSDRMDIDRSMPPPRPVAVKQEPVAPRAVLSVTADTDSRMATASPPLRDEKKRKSRGGTKDNESDAGRDKKPRRSNPRGRKEENGSSPAPSRMRSRQKESPGTSSTSNGRRASRASATPSSTAPPPPPPVSSRVVNEDYDEGVGVAETLMNLHKSRPDPTISPTRAEVRPEIPPPMPLGPPALPMPTQVPAPPPVQHGPPPPPVSTRTITPPSRPVQASPSGPMMHGPERPPIPSPAVSLPERRNSIPFGPSPPPPPPSTSLPSSKPQSPVESRNSRVQSPVTAAPIPARVFLGPPRPPEMTRQDSNGVIPPPPMSVTPAPSSPVTMRSPNGVISRTETPNGFANPRKRMTPPSPTPESAGLKRPRLDVPSPPRAVEPEVVAAPLPPAAVVPPSPPRSPAPPPIATLEDVSSPESTRSRSPVDPSDQLMDSRNSPAGATISPPADVAKVAPAPDVAAPMAVDTPPAPEPTKTAATTGPKEDSPMDMGE